MPRLNEDILNLMDKPRTMSDVRSYEYLDSLREKSNQVRNHFNCSTKELRDNIYKNLATCTNCFYLSEQLRILNLLFLLLS